MRTSSVPTKVFHVSPFNRVAGDYRFRFALGRGVQTVHIDYRDEAGPLLLPPSAAAPGPGRTGRLLGAFARMPLLTLGVIARIHLAGPAPVVEGRALPGRPPRQTRSPLQEPSR